MPEELRKFKDKEGHCNVPKSYSDNPELGRWVNRQRGQRLTILKERYSKLDSIGFTWNKKPDAKWEIMFEELRKLKLVKVTAVCIAAFLTIHVNNQRVRR